MRRSLTRRTRIIHRPPGESRIRPYASGHTTELSGVHDVLAAVLSQSYLRSVTPVRLVTLIAAVALLAAPLATGAQPSRNTPRIAILSATTKLADMSGPNPKDPRMRAFLQSMRE